MGVESSHILMVETNICTRQWLFLFCFFSLFFLSGRTGDSNKNDLHRGLGWALNKKPTFNKKENEERWSFYPGEFS